MNRRDFLSAMLAACAAPAIVRADSLMRIVPRETTVVTPFEAVAVARYMTMDEIVREALREAHKSVKLVNSNSLVWKKLDLATLGLPNR